MNQCRQVLTAMAVLTMESIRNILESAEEMRSKSVKFSENAAEEYKRISDAVTEILDLSYQAFSKEDHHLARKTEPLEQVIDKLKEDLRPRHFIRLQNGECSVAAGFIWSDLRIKVFSPGLD